LSEAGRDPSQLKVRASLVAGADTKAAVESGRKLAAAGVNHINVVASPDLDASGALRTIVTARKALTEELG
jgi:hypothetical protein